MCSGEEILRNETILDMVENDDVVLSKKRQGDAMPPRSSTSKDYLENLVKERVGMQSPIFTKMTEIPPLALLEVAKIVKEGSVNYPRNPDGTPNWYFIKSGKHLDHSLEHVFNFLRERNNADRDVDYMREELGHFATRALMALEMFLKENIFHVKEGEE